MYKSKSLYDILYSTLNCSKVSFSFPIPTAYFVNGPGMGCGLG